MTDKQLFMDKLRLALTERGVSDDDAAYYLNDRFYDILTEDSAENTDLDKVDLMADGIAARVKGRGEECKSEQESEEDRAPTAETFIMPELLVRSSSDYPLDPSAGEEQTVTISAVIDEVFDEAFEEPTAEIDILPHSIIDSPTPDEHTQTVDTVSEKILNEPVAEVKPSLSEYEEEYSDYRDEYEYEEYNVTPVYTEEPLEEVDYEDDFDEGFSTADDASVNRLPDYVEEKPIPNSKLFWVLFGVSSPVWAALLLLGLALFAGVWAALGLLIGASIVAMIAVIAVGSAATLVGIIYGIIEVFSPATLPVGIYNIGLGVISAGATMLLGILIYNFALRLLPWLIKLVGKFFKYTVRQLKQLFNFLRRECAKQ